MDLQTAATGTEDEALPFRLGHASDSDWQGLCDSVLEQLSQQAPNPNESLGFIYITDSLVDDVEQIVNYLRDQTGVGHWAGTVGVAICVTGREYYDVPALAVMLTDFPAEKFRVFGNVRHDVDVFNQHNGKWVRDQQSRFAIVHADPRNRHTPTLLDLISDELGGGFLVGGLSSSRNNNIQIADNISDGTVSGVLFAADVAVTTGLTQGCTPLKPKHEITNCRGNIITELDGRPALDVLKEDIGEVLARDLQRIGGYIFVGLPVAGSDTGDYLVRNLVGIDPEQGLIAIGENLSKGTQMMFCRRDAQTAQDDLVRMVRDVKSRAGKSPRGAIYHTCLGRGQHMFGGVSKELELVDQELGGLPLVGFYANGEISHNRLYGYTGVLTVF